MVNDIAVQDFVNAIKEEPTDTNTAYNAIVSRVDNEGVVWVNICGSDNETPTASTSTEVKRGDSVTVNWRNNKLYIGGNYSNPSAGVETVMPSVDYVSQLIDKDITVNSINAASAYIGELESKNIKAEDITADHAMIQELDVESMSAATAYIRDLTAENITAEDIVADHATVGSLDAEYAHITSGVIDNATIGYADVNGLSANYASVTDLTVATGRIDNLEANEAVINDTLTATNAHVEYLESDWISTDRLVLTGNNKNNYPPVEITESEFNVNKTAYYTKNGDTYTQCTSSSVYNADTQYYVKQSVKAIIEAINNANRYTEASPTQAQFNANKTNYYTYNGAEYIQCKSTDTYSSSTQYYIYDTQIVVSKDKLIAASMDVAELSAITADMGTLTAGKIEKGNNYINLNTSPASMEFKNASTWSGATQGIKFDTQGNLAIKGTVDITSSNTIYNKSQIDTALADKADADDVYSKSDFSITPSEIVSKVTATEVKLAGMYATCSTNAGTANKVAIISPNVEGWSLYTGATVTVKFSNANTVASPNLCVKGKSTDTGSNIAIKTFNGGTLAETDYKWSAGDTLTFIYNGTNWLMQEASARMKTAEASITTNAGNIALKANATDVYTKQAANALLEVKANKDTLTSEINASADTVKISADKVNITGVITAINNDTTTTIDGDKITTGSITIGQVSNLQTSIDNAAWALNVSISSIDYTSNTATLVATVYKYGAVQSSGFTLQWYKNGTAISGQTSATLSNVTADALYTCVAS